MDHRRLTVITAQLRHHPVLLGLVASLMLSAAVLTPSLRLHALAADPADLVAEPADLAANTYRVVGLGDSVMTANSCHGCTSFLQTAADRMATRAHRPVWVGNYAQDGAETSGMLSRLSSARVQQAIRDSNLVVIQVGANDFDESDARRNTCLPARGSQCYASTAATMRSNLDRIVDRVQHLQRQRGAKVVLMGYWNVFRDGQVGADEGPTYVKGSDQLTRWTNSITKGVASHQGARYADAYAPFKGRSGSKDPTQLLLADGDHPNATGQAVLASALIRAS